MDSNPLISCLCVTHDRVPMLRRAIACFLAQTHAARELVVLHLDSDAATREYLRGLGLPSIRPLAITAFPRTSLGARRNLMVAAAQGRYVATWDDDDWHAPSRLADQLDVIRRSGHPACVLRNVVFHDVAAGQSWLTQSRSWDQTLVAERHAMPPYADLDIAEDVPCVEALTQRGQLAQLASPHLYVYAYHGGNAGSATHFRNNVFAHSMPLSPPFSLRVGELLKGTATRPPTLQEVLAARTPVRP